MLPVLVLQGSVFHQSIRSAISLFSQSLKIRIFAQSVKKSRKVGKVGKVGKVEILLYFDAVKMYDIYFFKL
jgi:hypothetical protein